MIYFFEGILFGDIKKGRTDLHNEMDKSQKHYSKWKKTYTKSIIIPFI